MDKLRTLDLFAGAGGFTVAGELAGGYETVAFCEIDKYARKVLAKNWQNVPIFEDVTKLHAMDIDGTIDVITGGFPCQDLSAAGRGAGLGEGTRSGLFREMLRLAEEVREKQGRLPYIIFENVPRLLSGPSETPGEWFGEFLGALAEVGYDAEWFCITAASIGAPHERERVCVVAYSNETPIERGGISRRVYAQHADIISDHQSTADATNERQQGQGVFETRFSSKASGKWKATYAFTGGVGTIWETEPSVGRVANGLPSQSHRLGLMGNAIVPQVFAIVMRALYDAHYSATPPRQFRAPQPEQTHPTFPRSAQ
jgi:DNA (cytosine-5)-methyltransferase 1